MQYSDEEVISEEIDDIETIDAVEVVSKSYVEYSKYVAKTRAYPSILDGMKTVYRRMIYASRDYKSIVKSSAILGETAKIHPHGIDYGVLVSMTSKYGKFPLYHGKGNFGGRGFEPAAQRYTSAYLNDIARLVYLDLIDYAEYELGDSGFMEPKYLPALLPYALVAGSSGMSVGLPTTNIAPLNVMQLIKFYEDTLNGVPLEDREIPLPDFGGVILDGDPDEYRDIVLSGKGRMRFKPIVNNEAEGVYVVSEIPEFVNLDRLLKKLDYYIENDIVYYTDESGEEPRYVFETVDPRKLPPEELEDIIVSSLSCSKSFASYFEHNERVYSCGLEHVVNLNIKYLKECVQRKYSDKLERLDQHSQVLLAIRDLKESGELEKITERTTQYYIDYIMNLGYSEDTAKGVMRRSISYLTKSHDEEYKKMREDREEYQEFLEKPEKYLLEKYSELRDMLQEFYDSRDHSVFYDEGVINAYNVARLSDDGTKIEFSQDESDEGIEWKYQLVAVTDKGSFNVMNISRANTSDIELPEIDGERYVGLMSDITDNYIVIISGGNLSFIPKDRVEVGIDKYLRLREGQEVIGAYSTDKPKIKVTSDTGEWVKIDDIDDWVKSRISYPSHVIKGEIVDVSGRIR